MTFYLYTKGRMNNITSLSIGSVTFGNNNSFFLEEVKGLEFPTVRLPRFNLPGQSGGFISNALYGERAIKMKGIVQSSDFSRATYVNNRSTLINQLIFLRDVNNNLSGQTMTITLANGQVLTTTVYVDTPLQMGYESDIDHWAEFQVSFVCPDPNLYSAIQSSTSISLAVGGGTAIPTPIPISLAPSSGGQATITNIGGVIVYPIITLTPPLTNPFIANFTTNQFMKLLMTINVGAGNVVIDMNQKTITQNGFDVSTNMTSDSNFWGLFPGNNNIGFSATSGSGQALVSFYPAFLGI